MRSLELITAQCLISGNIFKMDLMKTLRFRPNKELLNGEWKVT